jgi:hypothetical protein
VIEKLSSKVAILATAVTLCSIFVPPFFFFFSRALGLGFRAQGVGLGFRAQGLGFRAQGLGFRAQGLGFRV